VRSVRQSRRQMRIQTVSTRIYPHYTKWQQQRFECRCSRIDRSPTLAYTHTLEHQVSELEAEVKALRSQLLREQQQNQQDLQDQQDQQQQTNAPSSSETGRQQQDEVFNVSRQFEGLKVDDQGVPTYHGPTSFFHFLGSTSDERQDSESSRTGNISLGWDEGDESRQKLVMNAWQQRAQEDLSQTPVNAHVASSPGFVCHVRG
jgi:hypothetical protein